MIAYRYCRSSSGRDRLRIVLMMPRKEAKKTVASQGKDISSVCRVGRSSRVAMIMACISSGRSMRLVR